MPKKFLRVAPRAICLRPSVCGSAVLLAVPEADAGQREVEAIPGHTPKLGEWCSAVEVAQRMEEPPHRAWLCLPLVGQETPRSRVRKADRASTKAGGRV